MNIQIVCVVISTIGVVVSSLVSWFVARLSANKELEKLRLSWAREDVISSDDEFAEMASAAASYISRWHSSQRQAALERIASIRSKEQGTLAVKLDHLYTAVLNEDCTRCNALLSEVIEEKRKAKARSNETTAKKPKT